MDRITKETIEQEIIDTHWKLKRKEITPRQAEVIIKGLKLALEWLERYEDQAAQVYKGQPEIKIEILTKKD